MEQTAGGAGGVEGGVYGPQAETPQTESGADGVWICGVTEVQWCPPPPPHPGTPFPAPTHTQALYK